MRPCAAGASKPPLLSRRRSLSTLTRERPPSADPPQFEALPPRGQAPRIASAGRDLALEVNCGSLCARDHATMDLIPARRQLAEMGKAATEVGRRTLGWNTRKRSGCDARRLSTGRFIRAWRTLCGRQMTRNAATRGRSLVTSSSLVLKIRRLAGNSKLGDDDGQPYRRVRVGPWHGPLTRVIS
jgi:hypothetical protein